ncbi:MAG: alpha/beta fold hydrolase [Bdellovibrionia bacterium]
MLLNSNFKNTFIVLFLTFFAVACSHTEQKTESQSSTSQTAVPTLTPQFDARLTGFEYPHPVKTFKILRQGQTLEMAYMDITPQTDKPLKGTFVLFHGKNFSGFYYKDIIRHLLENNYRVIVPDQVGFGKSSKPETFYYSFMALSEMTYQLLQSLNAQEFNLLGHSMGGMLATRYALMYPQQVKKLYLVNPIGLEDYKTLTSFKSYDEVLIQELGNSPKRVREYQQTAYYAGEWKPEYEALIQPAIGWIQGPDRALIAKNSALTALMIFNEPVVYEFKYLTMPVELIIGERDRTAIGKAWAPAANKEKMGLYPQLGPKTQRAMPKAQLRRLKNLGHVPFIENFAEFKKNFIL